MRMHGKEPGAKRRDVAAVCPYCEPIYRFCVKRLGYTEEAEDLAQSILVAAVEGLRKQRVENLEAWIWAVARNCHRRHFTRPASGPNGIVFRLDDDVASGEAGIEEALVLEEVKDLVFRAVIEMAEKYRRVLVAYYVRGESYKAITERLGIPMSSVKWRIHEGRRMLGEGWDRLMNEKKRVYDRIEMMLACNGSMDPGRYLGRQIDRAITLAAYEEPATIDEIGRATGIPAVYIEDEIDTLLYGEALEQVGKRYATSFIILKLEDHKRMVERFRPLVGDLASRALAGIRGSESAIRSIGFYGCDTPLADLLWVLLPRLLRAATNKVLRGIPGLEPVEYPRRRDEGNGWFVVSEGSASDYCDTAGLNTYGICAAKGELRYYWVMRYFGRQIGSLLCALERAPQAELIKGDGTVDPAQDEILAAMMIECGFARRQGSTVKIAVPLATREQDAKLASVLDGVAVPLAPCLSGLVQEVFQAFKGFTPPRLHGQIRGVISSYLHNIVGMVAGKLEEQGIMQRRPSDLPHVASVMVVMSDGALP